MVTVWIGGGLGNQMFMCAYACYVHMCVICMVYAHVCYMNITDMCI